MKKYMINPITGEETILEDTDPKWDIVEVHYDGEDRKYRAVQYNPSKVIIAERTFSTKRAAQEYIEKQ